MFDLLVFAILFALAFLAAFSESLTMLAFGLLGAMFGSSAHAYLLALYPWWTDAYGMAVILLLLIIGFWGAWHKKEQTSLLGAFIAGIGSAGLLTIILLPLLVSVFGRVALSPYAQVVFVGEMRQFLWTIGAFVSIIVASRLSR